MVIFNCREKELHNWKNKLKSWKYIPMIKKKNEIIKSKNEKNLKQENLIIIKKSKNKSLKQPN